MSSQPIGLQSYYLGQLARLTYDYSGQVKSRLLDRWRYTRTTLVALGMGLTGAILTIPYVVMFFEGGFDFTTEPITQVHLGVLGLLLMIAGFETFTFTLLLHALSMPRSGPSPIMSRRLGVSRARATVMRFGRIER